MAYVTYIQHIAANAVDPDSTLAIRSAALNGRPIPAPSDADITTVANRLINVVTAVRDKARNATVVLVGYLTVVPPTPNSLSSSYFNETTYPALLNLQSALATIFSRAASQSNATYFDTVAYSADHGVGTGDPWVFGIRDDADGVDGSFHPNEAGMQAVADGLAQLPAVQNALKVQDTSARSSASTLRPGWASVKRWMRGAEP